MPQQIEYPQSTPNWVELMTNDQSAAKKFYGSLLGWSFDDQLIPQGGIYSMAMLRGRRWRRSRRFQQVHRTRCRRNGTPTSASMISTRRQKRLRRQAERVVMAAVDVGTAGRMAWVADPTGAVEVLWQAGRHIGATLVNEPGASFWNELLTDKPDTAIAFYEAVLGVTHVSVDAAPGTTYHSLKVAGPRRRRLRETAHARNTQPLAQLLRGRRCRRHRA